MNGDIETVKKPVETDQRVLSLERLRERTPHGPDRIDQLSARRHARLALAARNGREAQKGPTWER